MKNKLTALLAAVITAIALILGILIAMGVFSEPPDPIVKVSIS